MPIIILILTIAFIILIMNTIAMLVEIDCLRISRDISKDLLKIEREHSKRIEELCMDIINQNKK